MKEPIARHQPVFFCMQFGRTMLHRAATKGHADICSLLIERGSNVNNVDAVCVPVKCVGCALAHRHTGLQRGRTALFQAVSEQHKEVVRILLAADADPDIPNTVSHTRLASSLLTLGHRPMALSLNPKP